MVPQGRNETRSRQKIAAENMTPAAKVHQQLQSGPIKSELKTVHEAIFLASAFNRQAKEAMELKGLDHSKNFGLVICYLTPDLSMLFTKRFVPGEESRIEREMAGQCCIMAGLIFGICDLEHRGDWLFGMRPFLVTPLVLQALRERAESDVIGIS
jgi:hypothetical protein